MTRSVYRTTLSRPRRDVLRVLVVGNLLGWDTRCGRRSARLLQRWQPLFFEQRIEHTQECPVLQSILVSPLGNCGDGCWSKELDLRMQGQMRYTEYSSE